MSIRQKGFLNLFLLGTALLAHVGAEADSLKADNQLSDRIFRRYLKLRTTLLRSNEKKLIENILPSADYPLTEEEKSFVSKFVLFRNPDPSLKVVYKDGVVEWIGENKTITVNLKNISRGELVIGKEKIKLDLNFGDDFKYAFKNNSSKIKSAVTKEYLAQLTFKDVVLMAVVLPFSVLSSCGDKQANDAELLSLAGWTEVKTAESPNYLYAQDRPGGKRAYLNAQTDAQAIRAGHSTDYYLNSFGTVARGQLVPSGATIVTPRGQYSENPNLISVYKQKLR